MPGLPPRAPRASQGEDGLALGGLQVVPSAIPNTPPTPLLDKQPSALCHREELAVLNRPPRASLILHIWGLHKGLFKDEPEMSHFHLEALT